MRPMIHMEPEPEASILLRVNRIDRRPNRSDTKTEWILPGPSHSARFLECSYATKFLTDFRKAEQTKGERFGLGYVMRHRSKSFPIEDTFPRSWLLPEGARVGEMIIAVGGFMPLLVRLRTNGQTCQ